MPASDIQPDRGEALGKAATVAVGAKPSEPHSSPSGDDVTLHDGEPSRPATHARIGPQMLGRYVVIGELGRGGMGSVYEAFDRTLDRRVAVKVLHRDVDSQQSERLMREAQALARLSHPNVVQVYEVGDADGQTFIAMELVRGQTLRRWAEAEPRPSWNECVHVYLQAGEGLAAAHAQGLVHRDFKPSNAVIDDDKRVRVLDFGLAREADDDSSSGRNTVPQVDPPNVPSTPLGLHTPLTQTGVVMGTPAYMPLEQLRGQDADARSDQFAYCVALYEALYGERPFEGSSTGALLLAVSAEQFRPAPKDSTVPTKLRQLVLRGLHADPDGRWPSMDTLLVELRALVTPKTRRWLVLGVASSLALALAGVGLSQYAAVGFRCEGAREALDGAWDAERRTAVHDAVMGTGVRHAIDTWQRVEQGLDDYADAWVRKQTEVCEATRVTELQSEAIMELRIGCLSNRRLALRDTVEVLAKADADAINQAVTLVDSLPELRGCDDVGALRADVPPPDDPVVARQVEALREDLARARMFAVVGDYRQGMDVAAPVVDRAQQLDYPPLLAEAHLQRGRLRDAIGEYAEAYADIERAYVLAVRHGHETIELGAATDLIHATGTRQARPEAGLQWGITALALAREPLDEARVLARIGSILKGQRELESALEHQRRALRLREEAVGPDHPLVASSLNGIAAILRRQQQFDRSLEHHQRALTIREQALGPRHPAVASTLNNMSNVLAQQGKPSEARRALERALAIREDALGPTHPKLTTVLSNLAELRAEQGEYAAARSLYERALAIADRSYSAEHPRYIELVYAIGQLHELEGDVATAAQHYQRALEGWEQVRGPKHPAVAEALVAIAGIRVARDAPGEAVPLLERALTIQEASDTPPTTLAETRFILARALWMNPSQRDRAHDLARLARSAYAAEDDTARHATVETWLASHRRTTDTVATP